MCLLIFIAVLPLLSVSIVSTEKGNEGDDDWVDLFYMDRKFETVSDDWIDPFDLEGYRNWKHTMMKNSIETDKEVPEEGKSEMTKVDIENTDKFTQKNEMTETVVETEDKSVEAEPETNSDVKWGDLRKDENSLCTENEMERNFLQRFVNLLINKCSYNNPEMLQKISVTLEIMPEELKELHRLREVKDTAPVIRLLNNIISNMKVHDHREDNASYFHLISQLSPSKEMWLDMSVWSFAVLPLCLFILGGRVIKILCVTLLVTFSLSYYGTYRVMLLKVKERNERILSKNLACSPEERSWYHGLFGMGSDSECQKRWNAIHIDPSLEITPAKVISHMLSVIAFQPLEQFGIMFSSFSSEIFESQPFLRGPFVFITGLLTIIIVIAFCCYGIFNTRRNLESHQPPHVSTAHPPPESEHQRSRRQMLIPGTSYEPHPHQPVYIITNYTANIPKEAVVKSETTEHQLHSKEGSSSSKIKTVKFSKTSPKSHGDLIDVPSDTTEITDDESEIQVSRHVSHNETKSNATKD